MHQNAHSAFLHEGVWDMFNINWHYGLIVNDDGAIVDLIAKDDYSEGYMCSKDPLA